MLGLFWGHGGWRRHMHMDIKGSARKIDTSFSLLKLFFGFLQIIEVLEGDTLYLRIKALPA